MIEAVENFEFLTAICPSLCEHIQMEGYHSGSFSDIIVEAMGTTYHLHRLILSRSSYFRNMLHGPWKEAGAPILTLNIDDDNVNDEAIAISLSYLYGHLPKLNDNNAFRVLAAASFLDLQDLCAICTDFIISELWTSNFLSYQVFAESQDYGIHGERVRNACWGYLCQSGTMELREMLPKLSAQTLQTLLTSDELWVPSEEKRFELAINVFLAKGALLKIEDQENTSSGSEPNTSVVNSLKMEKNASHSPYNQGTIASELAAMTLQEHHEGFKAVQKVPVDLADCVDFQSACYQVSVEQSYNHKMGNTVTMDNSHAEEDSTRRCSFIEMQNFDDKRMGWSGAAMEGPSEDSTLCCLARNVWHSGEESRQHSLPSSSSDFVTNDWGRGNVSSSWGGRVVSRQENNYPKGKCTIHGEDYAAFFNIFEGGSLLYCHMAFGALLNVRKQLEELDFPCKSLNDGLWLQMLLSQRVQETCAYTCKNCFRMACSCRQSCAFSHGSNTTGFVGQDHDGSNSHSNMGNVYLSEAQGEGNGIFGFIPMHIRGPNDGLAGIGQGSTFLPTTAWPPTRYVYSRVPFAFGNRNGQQSVANGETESRLDQNGDFPGDGLTALVGLSQNNNLIPVHAGQNGMMYGSEAQNQLAGPPSVLPCTSGIPQVIESQDHVLGFERENPAGSIFLDMKTPLPHFPPFRFGVEFHDVHRISDGQVKNSLEVFYAGSFWKISIQAFNDEDPQGRRTLGLFLHRRRAEVIDALQKAHVYIDSREKVMARYQLICPSKREVMVFGSLKQPGTLLPKAPKGWGWRTALLFDELSDLLQGGALRVAAVVQLV